MKLLVDNQLPAALARFLEERGLVCRHVCDLGLDASDDRVIWELAQAEHWVIVTKDEDFTLLANRTGQTAPQVVWVRIGNCRKSVLLNAFDQALPDLIRLLEEGRTVIEMR
ncbi:DUF5615 family PIN-like protein [Allochromatium palmeri]|uniref:DUF5615 domain-containing protein n=1 Tax=Allochromatium palmeri TaxID=231048 RepID=A0A6N8E795_9GAMM|nr:DUF5615 family PIN-like protein [Allochromatium palmeri]MTW20005.1 hypothetical protein [Allochromatium palmeri]